MSAAFSIGDSDYWGTNGAIEAYLGRMACLAADTPSINPILVAWLAEERESFFTGYVVFLDEVLTDERVISQFLGLLDRATAEFLRGDEFTEYGKDWIRAEIPRLRAQLAQRFISP
jgi:hypothetical protein